MTIWSWLKRKVWKTEVLTVQECTKSKNNVLEHGYKHGYGLLVNGHYGSGMLYQPMGDEIKLKHVDLVCLDERQNSKHLQVDYSRNFQAHMQQELAMGSNPKIRVNSLIGIPIWIHYANKKSYFCNAVCLTMGFVCLVAASLLLCSMFA